MSTIAFACLILVLCAIAIGIPIIFIWKATNSITTSTSIFFFLIFFCLDLFNYCFLLAETTISSTSTTSTSMLIYRKNLCMKSIYSKHQQSQQPQHHQLQDGYQQIITRVVPVHVSM